MKVAAKFEQANDLSWSGYVEFENGICVANGVTLAEARQELRDALRFHMEDPTVIAYEQIGETIEVA